MTILPTDGSAGYLVGDGVAARHPTGALNLARFAFPGPDPAHLWVSTSPANGGPGLDQVTVRLVDAQGKAAGPTLPVPYQGSDYAMMADGTGYVVAVGTGGTYLAHPDGLKRITTGAVLATGPTRWLTHDCDARGRCAMHVVDRASGARRGLSGPAPANVFSIGQISSDGRHAAIPTFGERGATGLVLVDLDTGRQRVLTNTDVSVVSVVTSQTMAWTPDARWLLVVGEDRVLRMVDPGTGRTARVSPKMPPLVAIAVRPQSGR